MSTNIRRGVILEVPYREKDEAKQLGACWDPDIRKWFVPEGRDARPFTKWLPASARRTASESRS